MANEFDELYSSPEAVRLAKSVSAPRAERLAAPYRRAATPQMFAQNAYYPEDENRAAERQRLLENNFMDYYRQNLSPEAIRKLTFEYARNELGMSDKDAAIQADHAASTATRTGYIADVAGAAPILGAGASLGREAINTARAMAAPAAEAAAPRILALPAPRSGPSSPIGMGVSGEPIPLGRPPVNPATEYRLASEQGQRVGPTRPPEFERDMMYDPSDIYLGREGNRLRTGSDPRAYRPDVVSREVDPIARLNAESPRADRQLGATQQAGRDAETAFRERQAAIAEAEGFGRPMTQSEKDFAQFQRELAATEERGAGNQFTPPAAAGEPRSPLLDMPAPGVKRRLPPPAEPAPAQPVFDFGGPQPTTGSFSPVIQGQASTTNAYAKNAIEIAKQRADALRRSAADASGQQAAIDAAAQRVAAERAASPNAMIDQAIADVTGQAPAGAAVTPRTTFGLRQRAPATSEGAARPAATAEAPLSAEEIASLRKNGFDDLADQVEAAQAQQAASAVPAAAARPAAAGPATPAASISGVPTPMGWGDKALIGGTVGALGLAGATADRNDRRQQKAADAVMSRQRIDDMDEAALAAVRNGSQPVQASFPSDAVDRSYLPDQESFQNWVTSQRPAARPAQAQGQPMGGNAPATRLPPAQMSSAPAGGGSFLDKIFSGKDYQSSGGQLQQQQGGNRVLNWGDSDNAADFFRADAMRKRMEDQKQQYTGRSGSDIDYENRIAASQSEGEGKARGGAAEQKPSKEAMLHKSLEIIHHMIKNR